MTLQVFKLTVTCGLDGFQFGLVLNKNLAIPKFTPSHDPKTTLNFINTNLNFFLGRFNLFFRFKSNFARPLLRGNNTGIAFVVLQGMPHSGLVEVRVSIGVQGIGWICWGGRLVTSGHSPEQKWDGWS